MTPRRATERGAGRERGERCERDYLPRRSHRQAMRERGERGDSSPGYRAWGQPGEV